MTTRAGQKSSTKNRNSFSFHKFGNASNLEACVDLCCRDDLCELALLSRGFHCFGVSCNKPQLCHKILDHLLLKDGRNLQQGSSGRLCCICPNRNFVSVPMRVAPRLNSKHVLGYHYRPPKRIVCFKLELSLVLCKIRPEFSILPPNCCRWFKP